MAKQLTPIDVTHTPELLRVAEEVRRSGEPRVLRRDREDLAVVVPMPRPSKRRTGRVKTKADEEAFLSSAGGWKGLVDVDKFVEDNYESRRRSSRPPVDL